MHEKIIILDFGGQYAHLIASRIRRQHVLAEIHQVDEISLQKLSDPLVKGIILSGGPQSVYDEGSVACDPALFTLGKPVLGICYGHQYMSQTLGGKVIPGDQSGKEFGPAALTHDSQCPLFADIPTTSTFWMSHGDEVSQLGEGFLGCGHTPLCPNAAVWHPQKNLFGIQFHPEVTHSEFGTKLLQNFLNLCQVQGDWTMAQYLAQHEAQLKTQLENKKVVLFVSGGVDSTVAFALLSKILGGDRVQGLFVDNGLLRQDEVAYVEKALTDIGAKLTVMRESDRFISNLKDVCDPEEKRRIIGNTFLDAQKDFFANQLGVQEPTEDRGQRTENLEEAQKTKEQDSANPLSLEEVQGNAEQRTESCYDTQQRSSTSDNAEIRQTEWVLAQGTIYPDTIETGGTKNAATIKTHHNRVPEIQAMIDAGQVIEPLADLYKDEVRALGQLLGLPEALVWRHPFPGPGLGVRILCNATRRHITDCEPYLKDDFLQLPLKSVGVQGDFRTYRHPGVLTQKVTAENFDLAAWEQQATHLINTQPETNRMMVALGFQSSEGVKSMSLLNTDITHQRVQRLQAADHIVTTTLQSMGLYQTVWQFPVVLAPIAFNETGQESIILRPIDSIDAMSASVGKLPFEFFQQVTTQILKDPSISAVFLDVTSKPPGTIEWE